MSSTMWDPVTKGVLIKETYNGYMVKERKVGDIVQSEGGGQSDLPLNGYQR